jgi:Tfp pilus assembly protein PilN
MTDTLPWSEPAVPAGPPFRLLPIAANLMPDEIVMSRRERRTRRAVLAGLTAFAVLLAAWYGLASYRTSVARDSLATVQSDAQLVLLEQRAFAEAVSTRAASRAISTQLASLLAEDLSWSRILGAVQQATPAGVRLTGISGALDSASGRDTGGRAGAGAAAAGMAAAGMAAAATLPGTAGHQAIGILTVTGSALSKAAVAAYLDALGKVAGLGNPLLGAATVQDGAVQFTVRVDVTEAARGGRYSSAGAGTGAR